MAIRASMVERQSVRNVIDSFDQISNPIRMGVVGLGHRSFHNVIKTLPHYEDYKVTAICDIKPEVVEKVQHLVKDEFSLDIPGYTDFDEMLKNESLDAVAIQIDPDKQVALAVKAMNAGCHVMIEVPTTYSIDECWDLVVTHERTGKVCLLMEQVRYAGYIRAWRNIIDQGVIGKPIFAEGEYFSHKKDAFFQDEHGRFYTCDQAKDNPQAKPTWRHTMPTIGYLPHELSPLLYALNDRVAPVTAMGTRPKSYLYDNLNRSDIQAALMHTEKDVVLRMAVGHSSTAIRRGVLSSHWHHVKGTKGVLEWQRSNAEKSKMWVEDWQIPEPIEIPWSTIRQDAPAEAAQSGHGGLDFFTFAHFADTILRNVPLEFDIYRACDTAAPAIMAAKSIEQGCSTLNVPDFRPSPTRKAGQYPNANK